MKKIEEKELADLQALHAEFNKLKTQLGDLALQKHGICLRVEELKAEFQTHEKGLVDKYTWIDIGSSYLMSELQAAFLFSQLVHFWVLP